MATIEITIDDEQMEAISEVRGLAALLKPVLDEILEAVMTEYLGVGFEFVIPGDLAALRSECIGIIG